VELRDQYSRHPTDSSHFRFFSRKVARAIYDFTSRKFITLAIREEIDFRGHVLSDPIKYRWQSPIAHLIRRDHDGETHQDACPRGAGFFLPTLISGGQSCGRSQSTSERDCNGMIPALFRSICLNTWPSSFGLAGAIVAWEMLPVDSRLVHPMILLWTDNTTAKAWTKKIAFTYDMLQTQFPWLKLSRRFTPSKELHALVYSALSQPSVTLPTTRVKLGQMIIEPSTSKQPFFRP
jgi:hypothetical protein